MAAITSAVRLRHNLSARLADARKRSDELFAIVRSESMYDRPIAERHRIIFYVGHYMPNEVIRQRCWVFFIMVKLFEPIPVKTIEPIDCTKPHKSNYIL